MDNIDPGASGFSDIFGSAATSETHNADTTQGAQQAAANDSEPELTAAERVAANLVSDLEADGIEIPEPGQDGERKVTVPDGADLDSLTPEQLRELAAEAINLRPRIAENDRQAINQAIQAADDQVTAVVQERYQTEVLGLSRPHYTGQFVQRNVNLARQAGQAAVERGDSPEQVLDAVIKTLAKDSGSIYSLIVSKQLEYEDQEAVRYEDFAEQQKVEARKRVPGLREAFARQLLAEKQLPDSVLSKVLKKDNGHERSIDDFAERVSELAAVRDQHLANTSKARNQQRQDANRELSRQAISLPSQTKQRSRKPAAMTGSAEEGAHMIFDMFGVKTKR